MSKQITVKWPGVIVEIEKEILLALSNLYL